MTQQYDMTPASDGEYPTERYGSGWVNPDSGPPGSAQSGSSAVPGNPNYARLQPIGDRTELPGEAGASSGSDASLSGTYSVQHYISGPARTIAFVYSNTTTGGAPGAEAITIKAAIKMQDTGVLPLTFGGKTSIVLPPGADAITDPVSCPVASGGYLRSLTYVSSAGGTWPVNIVGFREFAFTLEGFCPGADRTDGSTAGFVWDDNQKLFGPTLVLGDTGIARPIHGFLGDSITYGTGGDHDRGYVELAMSGTSAYVKLGRPGVAMSAITIFYGDRHRWQMLAGCTDIYNLYGRNDIGAGDSAATVAYRALIAKTLIEGLGARYRPGTILPGTSSTDSWATSTNQTVFSTEAERVKYNEWVRAGMKATAGAAVFDGSGTATIPTGQVFDIADAFETARNSGKWKSVAVGGTKLTNDGIHPNLAGHLAGATVLAAYAATVTL